MKEKLELREKIKKKKPEFKRQEWKRKNLETKWRKPMGIQSKMRMRKRGKGSLPNPGYGSPSEVRGLDRSGLREIIINNKNDLNRIDSGKEIAVISHSVGKRKRLEILEMAEKSNIKVKNH